METHAQQVSQQISALERRGNDLLLGHGFAQQQLGLSTAMNGQPGEPLLQRTLLAVEQVALAQRQKTSSKLEVLRAKVNTNLHALIEEEIEAQLDELDHLYTQVLGIEDAAVALIDLLASKGASINRLEPLVKHLSWLARELVTLVNQSHLRQDANERAVKIDTPALALRYLGLEKLKWTLPKFALRHWLPHSSEPFPLLKRKLGDAALSRATCAFELAELEQQNSYAAYVGALLMELGKVALTRLYLRIFQQIWQHQVSLAHGEGKKALHDALLAIEPDPLYLRNLFSERALEVTRRLIEKMGLEHLNLNAVFDDLALVEPHQLSGVAKILVQADGYCQAHWLQQHQLLAADERQLWFSYLGLKHSQLTHLATINFSGLTQQIDAK
ncbi:MULTISPECIES: HDOD domain-containing protein [unclassified Pseudoalteromonas]|uniref:HDOD domain-containing protein n=1 Tax=unclassified Pseudoalteromonas TaxID=194690 RepID=UPI000CF6C58A|nr:MULTISPECIES: HDOD domain-containing protein [unclassified Pseudoalteromonas]MBS3797306.1 HDOD domain-containing protein [Pseudoalteromonas sp. BDTF-M6]